MISRKQQCFDYLMIFILIVGGVCLGGIAFGVETWAGRIMLWLLGAFFLSMGILHAIKRSVDKSVDDSEE